MPCTFCAGKNIERCPRCRGEGAVKPGDVVVARVFGGQLCRVAAVSETDDLLRLEVPGCINKHWVPRGHCEVVDAAMELPR